VKTLAQEVQSLGHTKLKLLYADQERFYLPEFEVAKQEFAKHGVTCDVVSEMRATEAFVKSGLFLDLPFFYHQRELYETLIPAYKKGKVGFIIPPKPFLGAKGVLALLRNDQEDKHLEALLGSFIAQRSLELVRRYIPETILVGKQAEGTDSVLARVNRKKYVLKESISSGMKGTVFSDDEEFGDALSRARAANLNWILQEEVENQLQTFSWFDMTPEGAPEVKTASDWSMRVTAQYVNRTLGDVIVTACRDKAVHGGKNCLQVGTVIV
jgi:hypothetical protein